MTVRRGAEHSYFAFFNLSLIVQRCCCQVGTIVRYITYNLFNLIFFSIEASYNCSDLSGCGWDDFIHRSELLDAKNGLLQDDKLTILCEVRF